MYFDNKLLCSKIEICSSTMSVYEISIKDFSPTQQISPDTHSSGPVYSGHTFCSTASNHWVSAMMSSTCYYTQIPCGLHPTLLPSLIFNIFLQGLKMWLSLTLPHTDICSNKPDLASDPYPMTSLTWHPLLITHLT